jgi:hypothetical protein
MCNYKYYIYGIFIKDNYLMCKKQKILRNICCLGCGGSPTIATAG